MAHERPWGSPLAPRDGRLRRLRANRRLARVMRFLFVAGIVAGSSAALALALTHPRGQMLLVPPLALGGLWLVGRFPLAAAAGVLALSATLVEPGMFKVAVGPLDVRLSELLLGALLLVALLKPRRDWWGGPAGVALLVFFGVVGLSAALAVAAGRAHPVDAYHYSRSLAPLLLFFVIVRLFPEPRQAIRLLVAAAVMAGIAGFVSVLAAAPGSPVMDALGGNDSTQPDTRPLSERTGMGVVNRVRLPGVALAYPLFWFAALRLMRAWRESRRRALWSAVVIGMAVGLALSFNRNMWVGLALGLVMVLVLARTRARRQIVAGLLILVAAGALFGLSGIRIPTDSPVYPIVARLTTLFDPQREAQDSSLTDRFYENRYAAEAIRENPVVGVGPGAPYGLTDVVNYGNRVFERKNALFVHNQYLHLLLIAGPLALVSFLAFVVTPILTGLRQRRRDDVFVALSVGIVMTLVSAIVMISFVDAVSATVLGLVVGTLTVSLTRPRPADAASFPLASPTLQ